jgi:hypothetical protein
MERNSTSHGKDYPEVTVSYEFVDGGYAFGTMA